MTSKHHAATSRRTFLCQASGVLTALSVSGGLHAAGTPPARRFTLADMPRVDAHAHIRSDWKTIDEYLALRQALRQQLNVELAAWVSLGSGGQKPADPPDLAELRKRYEGRIAFCIFDYTISDGLRYSPQELVEWQARGAAGFKFYPGWQKGVQIDQPAFAPVFAKMAEIGLVAASPHVANPCGTYGRRTEWFAEPVEFWRQQHAWENVLKRHPRLVVVNAHLLWLCCSDEQLDYLRYMLKTYPQLHLDLATTPVFLHAVGRDNLRDFIIEHAERILFGTDVGSKWFVPELDKQFPNVADKVPQYRRYFAFLETDQELSSGIKDEQRMRGLALPLDVLEKIYFRNAVRIYAPVREALTRLGYLDREK